MFKYLILYVSIYIYFDYTESYLQHLGSSVFVAACAIFLVVAWELLGVACGT